MNDKIMKISRLINLHAKNPGIRRHFSSQSDNYRLYAQQRTVGYSCEQMFSVVSEVERYHSFVPWCKKSVIKKKKSDEQLTAELVVGFPPYLGESYTSTVTMVKVILVLLEFQIKLGIPNMLCFFPVVLYIIFF